MEDSSSTDDFYDGSGGDSDGGEDLPIKTSVDFRDIPGQIDREADYIARNIHRKGKQKADFWYGKEQRNRAPTGKFNKDPTATGGQGDVGLFNIKSKASIYEQSLEVGKIHAGVIDEADQKGIETSGAVLETKQKLGAVEVKTNVLSGGYEAGIGRNTGGFVRAKLASVGGQCGPVGGHLGVGFDTGGRLGADGVEAKFAGTGFMVDREEGIELSLFGSSVKFKLW